MRALFLTLALIFLPLQAFAGNIPPSSAVCPTGLTCVRSTGVPATDTANIQSAVNHDFAIVLLVPGYFGPLTAPITITHQNVTVMGWSNGVTAGLGGSSPPYPTNTTVDCTGLPNGGGHGGCFTVTNQNAHFSGFQIYSSLNGLNCIADGDSGLLVDGRMLLTNCYTSIYVDIGVGTTTGFVLNTIVDDIIIEVAYQFGIFCNCSDYMFGPNIDVEVAGANYTGGTVGGPSGQSGAIGLGSGSLQGSVFNNFLDSNFGAPCVNVIGGILAHVVGNRCDASVGLIVNNGGNLTFNDNWIQPSTNNPAIQFYGTNGSMTIVGNHFPYSQVAGSSCFYVDPGASAQGTFADNDCELNNLTLYANTNSETVIDPQVNPHPIGGQTVANTSGTFAAPDWKTGFDVTLPLAHGANTLPNPVYTAFGQHGSFTVPQSPGGTDTIGTLGSKYITTFASQSTTAYAIDIYPWQTNAQGNIVIGTKTATITPSSNLLTGGNGMTSGWSNVGLTSFTLNATTDPIGGSTGAKYIEDTSTGNHGVTQTLSGLAGSTAYTCAMWFKEGSGSFRDAMLLTGDAGGDFIWSAFDGVTGAVIGGAVSGTGSLIGSGLVGTAAGGWIRVYMTFSLPTAPVDITAGEGAFPTYYFYTGDGSTTGFVWGPTCRLGNIP